ncbi:MAG: glycosyltransferase [Clostridia bacterium]|nr:glycosyltransferase [Clostridia bacterium]
MRNGLLDSLETLFARAGQPPAGAFPVVSEAFNRRYAAWRRTYQPSAAVMGEYTPHIDVIGEKGVPDDALKSQTYRRCTLLRDAPGEGEYLMYLFKGDVLHPDALRHFVAALNASPRPDLLFADEDVHRAGARLHPHFKCALNNVDLLSYNCIGRPLLVRRSLHDAAKPMTAFSEEAAYAYTLRCALRAARTAHIDEVLLSRAALPALSDTQGRACIDAYLQARGWDGYAVGGLCKNTFRLRTSLRAKEQVSIIIPNKNNVRRLRRLLESIEQNALYPYYRIRIVDAGSENLDTLRYYELLRANRAADVLTMPSESTAALWNFGARSAKGALLLFLRPDTVMDTPGFLVPLMDQTHRAEAGVVGCAMASGDGALLAAGTAPAVLCENVPWLGQSVRAASLLHGACAMLTSDLFFHAGCFDETFFSAGGAVAEMCIRLMRRGQSNIYTPAVTATVTGTDASPSEKERERLEDVLRPLSQRDPCLSPRWMEVWDSRGG